MKSRLISEIRADAKWILQILKNEYFMANIGFDTAESEPSNIWATMVKVKSKFKNTLTDYLQPNVRVRPPRGSHVHRGRGGQSEQCSKHLHHASKAAVFWLVKPLEPRNICDFRLYTSTVKSNNICVHDDGKLCELTKVFSGSGQILIILTSATMPYFARSTQQSTILRVLI